MTGTRPPVPEAVPVTAVPGPPLPVLAAPFSARTARHDGPALDLVCAWMRRPHVEEFWHQAWPRQRWSDELCNQLAGDHSLPVLVDHDGSPLAYVEVYRVCRDRLGEHYPHDAHDLGLHIAIGDRDRTGKGLGRALL
ncbi:GNAT family N-acetyltransferase, partial [Streptomyces sp. NPDC003860]